MIRTGHVSLLAAAFAALTGLASAATFKELTAQARQLGAKRSSAASVHGAANQPIPQPRPGSRAQDYDIPASLQAVYDSIKNDPKERRYFIAMRRFIRACQTSPQHPPFWPGTHLTHPIKWLYLEHAERQPFADAVMLCDSNPSVCYKMSFDF